MGLRTASWVAPFGGIALALISAYGFGLLLSLRLARRIVNVIDGLSDAALRVGQGDFSVRVTDAEQDQLGRLAASFNAMTDDLEHLRERERQRAMLERDIALGQEAQQYLYPRRAPALCGASVWGLTQPACLVSGDLYDFLSFTEREVGLICADVSGKGTAATLMMANLQAVAHGRLLLFDSANIRPAPDAFVTALNRDLSGRFGDNALNAEGEPFGEERILHCLSSLPGSMDAEGICEHLAGKVAEWAAGVHRSDDTTILALSVKTCPSPTALSPSIVSDARHRPSLQTSIG
jgi:serine phosphatase RsbU (regulator of sigma subunit)